MFKEIKDKMENSSKELETIRKNRKKILKCKNNNFIKTPMNRSNNGLINKVEKRISELEDRSDKNILNEVRKKKNKKEYFFYSFL